MHDSVPSEGQASDYDVCSTLSRTMLWSMTEFIELTKVYAAYIYKAPYNRKFVLESEVQPNRDGFISLFFLEEERICADYYDEFDFITALPPDVLNVYLHRLLVGNIETIKSIEPDSQITDALIEFDDNGEIAIVQPKGGVLWITALVQFTEVLYKAVSAIHNIYSELLLPVLPNFNMSSQLCIGDDVILPLQSPFISCSFESLATLLDKHLIFMRTILHFIDMDLASILRLDLNARQKNKSKQRAAITFKEAAAMLQISTRTIEKWESGDIRRPAKYPGRDDWRRFKRGSVEYLTLKVLRRETRAKNKPIVSSNLLDNYLPPTGKPHKSGRASSENEDDW